MLLKGNFMLTVFITVEKQRHKSKKGEKSSKSSDSKEKGGEKDDEEEEDEEEEEEEEDVSLSDVDDEEIEAMILTEEEVNLKTKIWYNANKEYLQEMAVRREVEKDKGTPYSRKGKGHKKKKLPPPSTPAEAAKQLLQNKKLSKKINQAVFDDMFESAESIAKIKQRDAISRMGGQNSITDIPEYEVVEESGDVPVAGTQKKKTSNTDAEAGAEEAQPGAEEDEDDDDMDSDDMADDERLLRDQRAKFGFNDDDDDVQDYYSDEGY